MYSIQSQHMLAYSHIVENTYQLPEKFTLLFILNIETSTDENELYVTDSHTHTHTVERWFIYVSMLCVCVCVTDKKKWNSFQLNCLDNFPGWVSFKFRVWRFSSTSTDAFRANSTFKSDSSILPDCSLWFNNSNSHWHTFFVRTH